MQAEIQYPAILPYRRSQAAAWEDNTPEIIADELKRIIKRKRQVIKYIRVSEAGDFKDQADVEKLKLIAKHMGNIGITLYGYTARRDLEYRNMPGNLIINGSSFMVSNNFSPYHGEDDGAKPCAMNCRSCNLCKVNGNNNISVPLH